MVKAPARDFRDWVAIAKWARELPQVLMPRGETSRIKLSSFVTRTGELFADISLETEHIHITMIDT